jgi:hypothetical protein
MSKQDYVYAAGLVDGEGSVTLTRQAANENRAPILSVTSTTPELLEFLRRLFGGTLSVHHRQTKKHSASWSWKVQHNRALRALRAIYPYMREREKRRRVKLLMTEYASVTSRNGKYNQRLLNRRKRFEGRFFANSRSLALALK